MPDPAKGQDISFELTPEHLARLKPIIDHAGARKLLLMCSVKKEGSGGKWKLVFHAAFHDANFIAANSPFGPPHS